MMALLNSQIANHIVGLINPTINLQVGDLARLPVPDVSSDRLRHLVDEAIELAKADSQDDETTWDFIAPPAWPDGIEQVDQRHRRLAEIEREIDEEVYRLYGISEEDRRAIEQELAESTPADEAGDSDAGLPAEEADPVERAWNLESLARAWVSYAVGIVVGRFEPGRENGLGRGSFSADLSQRLSALADSDGVVVLDEGHRDDLGSRVWDALTILLGESAAREVVREATGRDGQPANELRRYFSGPFFKEHVKQYRKRPIYWLLQSPKKKYGVYVFHERLSKDTLFRIRGDEYVGSKLKLLDSRIAELAAKRDGAEGRERRRLEKAIDELETLRDDVQAFAERIDAVTRRGYTPHIDDGVLINMAPLWELVPSWKAEPKKCWQALERGDYDWSHMAMDYWPERVREKCRENKSYAIAHGMTDDQ